IGTIGAAARTKGYPDVLAAVSRLAGKSFDLIIAAMDDGFAMLGGAGAQRRIASTEPEMAAFYASSDIFGFPSHSEGFGPPPLDAIASGSALVPTDCGGVSAFARPGPNCLMVPPGDPAALAAAIGRLLDDSALREKLAAAGVTTAVSWPRERMTAA